MKLTDVKDILYQIVLWMLVFELGIFGLALGGFIFKFFYNVWLFGWRIL
jgi:hypothetical protein